MAYFSKWMTYVAGIYQQVLSGFCYTFSLYSNELKIAFDLNQTQLQGIGTAISTSSGVLGWIACTIYDRMLGFPRLGPVITSMIGSVAQTAGYFAIWAAATGHFRPQYWMLLLFAIVGSSNTATQDAACIATGIRNFPNYRGHVAGVQKALLGLSASVAASVYLGVFAPNRLGFLLFVALMPVIGGFFFAPFLNYVPFTEGHENGKVWGLTTETRFGWAYFVVAALAIYQLVIALVSVGEILPKSTNFGTMVGTFLILAVPLLIPLTVPGWPFAVKGADAEPSTVTPLLEEDKEAQSVRPKGSSTSVKPPPRLTRSNTLAVLEEKTTLQCFCSIEFWVLWGSLVIALGLGTAFLNNVSQIVESIGAGDVGPIFVSIYAIFNCFGRMGMGYLSEVALHRWGTPRTVALVLTNIFTTGASLFTAFANLPMLYVSAALSGISLGSCYSMMMVITSEIFGMRSFGSNQCAMHFAPTVGSLIFATQVTGNLYQAKARQQGSATTCLGADCFRTSFLIIAACNFVASFAAFWLYRKTRYIYRKQIDDVAAPMVPAAEPAAA